MRALGWLGNLLPVVLAATAIVLLLTHSAKSEGLVYHTSSFHTDLNPYVPYNEINPGVGWSWEVSDYQRNEVGVYLNSYSDISLYAVTDLMVASSEWGVFFGVATGYQEDLSVPEHGVTLVGGVVHHGDGYTNRVTPLFDPRDGTIGFVQSFSF